MRTEKNSMYRLCRIVLILGIMMQPVSVFVWWNGEKAWGILCSLISAGLVIGALRLLHRLSEAVWEGHSEADWYQVTVDELTGMYNSRYFMQRAEQRLHDSHEKYYLIYTDILNYSLYNKIFGDEKGSELLKEFSKILRELNHRDNAMYGRLFVDEFAILIPESSYDEAYLIEEISTLQDKFTSTLYQLKIYVGVYAIEDNRESGKSVCLKAKVALDTIKGDFDKILIYYDEGMLKEIQMKQRIIGEFGPALDQGQFCIYLQPQMTADGEVLGAEALIRWKHPKEGMIPPAAFIPVLEETSMITKLDRYVWEQAAQLLAQWKDKGQDRFYISVNVSAMDFYYIDIYEVFTSLVEKYDISPCNLKIEITETVLMSNAKKHIRVLERLRAYGFEVELDDFGSGYSSLNMLKDIVVDVIKLDMGFLDKTEQEKRQWSILSNVVHMSEELGSRIVTEGVETREQVDRLFEIGCRVFQGYYFSRPMEAEAFIRQYIDVQKGEKDDRDQKKSQRGYENGTEGNHI